MQLVEQHLIRKTDPAYAAIDAAAFASKNLYNQATYQIRQAFIHEGKYLPYAEIFHRIKHMDCYQALPRKVSNSILILIHKNWVAFFKANEAYKADPSPFVGRPHLPGYKDKEKGRNLLIYDKQALGKRLFKQTGKLVPSGLPLEIETKVTWEQLDQVRIVPRGSWASWSSVSIGSGSKRSTWGSTTTSIWFRSHTAASSTCSLTRHSLSVSR